MTSRIVVLTAAVLSQAPAGAQQRAPGTPARSFDGFSVATTAIMVDVVVRDKRGRPITDLTRDDFEILENAVPQTIGSFSIVSRASGIGIQVRKRVPGTTMVATSSTTEEEAPEAEHPPVTALVFDALSPEALSLAQRSALAELPMNGPSPGRVGVFTAEPGLRLMQPYTEDVALVRAAVRRVSAAGEAREQAEAERRQQLSDRLRQLDVLSGGVGVDRPAAFAPGTDNSTTAQAIVEAQLANMEMRLLRNFESIDRDHRGFGTASALLTVIQSLNEHPGRKTIVYFSQGLPASPSMQARLDSVVSTANRANVSVYAIDAAGLRSESTLLETRRELDVAAEERLRQSTLPDMSDGPMMRNVERAEDLLRLDPQAGLARLAEDTGGFLVRDTNDLGSAFRRIEEDNRFHYILTYSPTNENFDGKFRTIGVKVKRDGAQVFSRKGYFAVRSMAAPVLSYEAPALAALDRARLPNQFAIGADASVFPEPSGKTLVPIVVRVSTDQLSFNVDRAKGTYSAQAAVVARIKDTRADPILTLSQQYVLTGTTKELDAAKMGEILFYRQADLPPGVYTLEAVVYDAIAERASARVSTISVPSTASNRLAVSSLVLIRRAEQVPAADRAANLPFYVGETLLYPRTGEPYDLGRDKELGFYISFYPRATAAASPRGTVELLRNGKALASAPIDLAPTGAKGRVQHAGVMPIASLPVGTYELRVRLEQQGDEQTRAAFFTIASAS